MTLNRDESSSSGVKEKRPLLDSVASCALQPLATRPTSHIQAETSSYTRASASYRVYRKGKSERKARIRRHHYAGCKPPRVASWADNHHSTSQFGLVQRLRGVI